MSNLIPCRSKMPVVLRPFLFITLLALSGASCHKIAKWFSGGKETHIEPQITTHWLNWNFYFGSSVPGGGKDAILNDYKKFLKDFAQSQDPTVTNVLVTLHYCPCDSSLTNLDATIVSGSGKSISPPPTIPKPGPSGDYILTSNKMKFQVADSASALLYDTISRISIPVLNNAVAHHDKIDGRVLAIIDTGLDTAAFSSDITQLMWKDPTHPTLYDVMPGHDPFSSASIYDSNKVKHGTAAAALAISQITNNTIPRIMAIKAFDVNEKGSIYTVSCALSYAIQQHVNFINASWGYFGDMDSVLFHYVKSASDSGIAVIAAAGNTAGNHPVPICNPTVNIANLLQDFSNAGPSHLFYPACFSRKLDNLISVHQLQSTNSPDNFLPCFYQDYSGEYVNLGIVTDNQSCCMFNILNSSLEGSSFATPVATGMLMSFTKDGLRSSMKDFVDTKSKHYEAPLYTRRGNYLGYVSHFTIR